MFRSGFDFGRSFQTAWLTAIGGKHRVKIKYCENAKEYICLQRFVLPGFKSCCLLGGFFIELPSTLSGDQPPGPMD